MEQQVLTENDGLAVIFENTKISRQLIATKISQLKVKSKRALKAYVAFPMTPVLIFTKEFHFNFLFDFKNLISNFYSLIEGKQDNQILYQTKCHCVISTE